MNCPALQGRDRMIFVFLALAIQKKWAKAIPIEFICPCPEGQGNS